MEIRFTVVTPGETAGKIVDTLHCSFLQVERRVVNQLAAAHERELISPGCSLHLTVDRPKGESGRSLGQDAAPIIKLQLIKEGKKKVDIDVGDFFVPEDKLYF